MLSMAVMHGVHYGNVLV